MSDTETMTARAPNGEAIVSSLEMVPARSFLNPNSFTEEDGELNFDYMGTSEYEWENSHHATEDGERLFVAADGSTWKKSEIVLNKHVT
jgi:hypothetical protein